MLDFSFCGFLEFQISLFVPVGSLVAVAFGLPLGKSLHRLFYIGSDCGA